MHLIAAVLIASLVAVIALVLLAFIQPRLATALLRAWCPNAIYHYTASRKVVSLAIDDGPAPSSTLAIAELLKFKRVSATFFVIGEHARAHQGIIAQIAGLGHDVGAHFDKDQFTALHNPKEISASLDATIAALPTGLALRFARPGYGIASNRVTEIISARGLLTVVGDIPALDALGLPITFYRAYLRLVVRPGSIITLHDRGDRGLRTLRLLPLLLNDLAVRGYSIEPLPRHLG